MSKKYLLISLGLVSSLIYANEPIYIKKGEPVHNPSHSLFKLEDDEDDSDFYPLSSCSEFFKDIADFSSPLKDKEFNSKLQPGPYYCVYATGTALGYTRMKYVYHSNDDQYSYFQFVFVPVRSDRLKEDEKKIFQYFGGDSNSTLSFVYAYGPSNPPNINSTWGVRINDKLYLAVWVLDPETNTERLVDKNRKVIANKSTDGKITFLNK